MRPHPRCVSVGPVQKIPRAVRHCPRDAFAKAAELADLRPVSVPNPGRARRRYSALCRLCLNLLAEE